MRPIKRFFYLTRYLHRRFSDTMMPRTVLVVEKPNEALIVAVENSTKR